MKNVDSKQLLQKYRIYLIPTVLMILSLCMAIFVILHQFGALSENNRLVDEQKKVVLDLQNSVRAINEMNGPSISSQLTSANHALPTAKDVVLIYSSLTAIAQKNNVQIKSFSVKVGTFYNKTGQKNTQGGSQGSFPNLKIVLGVAATNFENVSNFSKNIYENLPLAEINLLQADAKSGNLEIFFFYKPVDIATLSRQTNLTGLTPAEKTTLEKLSQWDSLGSQ